MCRRSSRSIASAATRSARHGRPAVANGSNWEIPPGGMFVWLTARDPDFDTDVLYSHALAEKVAFVPSSVFDPAGGLRNAMRLNFTRSPPERLVEGVARLERAVRGYLAARPGRAA